MKINCCFLTQKKCSEILLSFQACRKNLFNIDNSQIILVRLKCLIKKLNHKTTFVVKSLVNVYLQVIKISCFLPRLCKSVVSILSLWLILVKPGVLYSKGMGLFVCLFSRQSFPEMLLFTWYFRYLQLLVPVEKRHIVLYNLNTHLLMLLS